MGHVVDTQREMALVRTPEPVPERIIAAQSTFLEAIKLCVQLSGLNNDKAMAGRLNIEPAQWSKIQHGQAHFPTDKYNALMDECGNEAPLLWLLHSRGYDIGSLRKRQTEQEKRIQELEESLAASEYEKEVLLKALRR